MTTTMNPSMTNETPLELEVERIVPPADDNAPAPSPVDANDEASTERAIASRLERVERELETTRRALERADRSSSLDRRLIAAGVIDLDAARALVPDAKLDAASSDDAVAALVTDLRRAQPSLFRRLVVKPAARRVGSASTRSALAPAEDESAARTPEGARLASATTRAAATGRVDDLMRYLRAKRNAATTAA